MYIQVKINKSIEQVVNPQSFPNTTCPPIAFTGKIKTLGTSVFSQLDPQVLGVIQLYRNLIKLICSKRVLGQSLL